MREADERGGTFLARLCHAGKLDPLGIRARVKTSGAGHSRGLQTPAAKSVAVQPVVIGGAAGTCRRSVDAAGWPRHRCRCRQSRGDVIAQPADVSGLKTSSLDAIDFKGPRRSGSSPSSRTHSLPEMAEKREASCDSSGNGEVAEHQNRIASTPERFFCPARGMQAAGIDPLALAHARGSAPKSRICWSSRYVNYLIYG